MKMPEALTVGQRLHWLRELKELTLKQFAERIDCDAGYLSKLESGKATNPTNRFLAGVCATFRVNIGWLRDGDGDPFRTPDNHENLDKALSNWSRDRLHRVMAILDELPEALATDAVLGLLLEHESLEDVQEIWAALRSLPNFPAPARLFWNDAFTLFQLQKNGFESDLTKSETSRQSADVKPQLPLLLKRLNTATEQPGKKSELAEFLKAPLASVSRWLSGDREPGGEVTLKMLQWVEQQERK